MNVIHGSRYLKFLSASFNLSKNFPSKSSYYASCVLHIVWVWRSVSFKIKIVFTENGEVFSCICLSIAKHSAIYSINNLFRIVHHFCLSENLMSRWRLIKVSIKFINLIVSGLLFLLLKIDYRGVSNSKSLGCDFTIWWPHIFTLFWFYRSLTQVKGNWHFIYEFELGFWGFGVLGFWGFGVLEECLVFF